MLGISVNNIQSVLKKKKKKKNDTPHSQSRWTPSLTLLDSSTLKLYLVAKNIKVRYTKPKEFWSPTWRLTFESWSPAQ